MKLHRIAVVAAASALLVPAGVFAKGKPEHAGKGKSKIEHAGKGKGKSKGKGHAKPKMHVFKGTWNDANSTVVVTGGNGRVKKGDFVGTEVAFDFSSAKVNVADTNADGVLNQDDFVDGDKLVVQVKMAADAASPYVARKAIDQTNPKADDSEETEETEDEESEVDEDEGDEDVVEPEISPEPTVEPIEEL